MSKKAGPVRVAYMMSRFPKITETFVLYEMIAVEAEGVEIEVFPLQRERTDTVHPEAVPFVERAHFTPFFSWGIAISNVLTLFRRPVGYLGTLATLVRANFGSRRYLVGALAFFPKAVHLSRLMRAAGIDHVHAHFASHPAAMAYVIHRLSGLSYSFTGHGSDLNRDQHMLKEKVEAAEMVVPISEFFLEMIVKKCGEASRSKLRVIHCGVDTSLFNARTADTPYDQGTGPLRILAIGTLHEVKGQIYLIRACGVLRDHGVSFECHLIGDGPDEPELREAADELGIADAVVFHGRQPREFIVEALSTADVVVTPSVPSSDGRREGIPVVLMESMACGLPVVSTRMSGIPELVDHGENGFLTEAFDVDGLAAALRELAEDGELRKNFGKSGREKVVAEFDLSRNAAALADWFKTKAL